MTEASVENLGSEGRFLATEEAREAESSVAVKGYPLRSHPQRPRASDRLMESE